MFDTLKRAVTLALLAPLWPGAALAEVPNVVTDIAPVQSLVARVMAGLGTPSVVVRPGTSPHGYALRPSDADALQEAEAVFWIGPELEPWLEGAITTLAGGAQVTPLLDAPGTGLLAFRTGARFAPHEHHGAVGRGDGTQDHAGHAHGDIDPHAWLDPRNAQVWLDVIAQTLGQLDPQNAAVYRANADVGKAEIAALEAELQGALAPVRDTPFVVFHDAFHYFEHRFGLAAVGAIAAGDASDPGPARIEAVRDTVQRLGVGCVLAEPAFNPSLIPTVAGDSDLRTGLVDPIGRDLAPGTGLYPALLRAMAAELVACLE